MTGGQVELLSSFNKSSGVHIIIFLAFFPQKVAIQINKYIRKRNVNNEFVDDAMKAANSIGYSKWNLAKLVSMTTGFKSLLFIKYWNLIIGRFEVSCI